MKFLLVGGGAREHALGLALTKTPDVKLFVVSKHKNPGLAAIAKQYLVADETNVDAVVKFAQKNKVEWAVVGPEAPLAVGLSDRLRQSGIHACSPTKAAAEIETSKRYMRELLAKHKISGNVRSVAYDSAAAAKAALAKDGIDVALKPVGLTGGKGVRVFGDHFTDLAGASQYVDEVFAQRIGGEGILIEERLEGEEFTVQCFTDGRTVIPTVAVQDHKRLLAGDEGPNTGGMGSYSQADGLLPFLPKKVFEEAVSIVRRIVLALGTEGRTYVGPIYGQFMLTKDGPKVIEVNARFGDPEAMNVLALLQTPYADVAIRMSEHRLGGTAPRFDSLATVVKYVVPEGYGTKPATGVEIKVNAAKVRSHGAEVYFANVEEKAKGRYACGTSRAIAVLGRGETVHQANDHCEAGLAEVKGERIFVRHDIGTATLLDRRVKHMRAVLGGK
ncbi:MAG: phosphoribosylamine--glycine ligase [Euryarchaeota archaeon]|nr:phosphoribosylamine--glycine ligase [Euryarchaeota archaeon]